MARTVMDPRLSRLPTFKTKGRLPMPTVTKKDLIDRIAEQTGQRRVNVKRTVQSFLDLVTEELADGNRLEFRDFGVFEIRERKRRIAQNPKTLERVEVPAKRVVKFKVGRLMQQSLDDGHVQSNGVKEPGLDKPQVKVRTARTRVQTASV